MNCLVCADFDISGRPGFQIENECGPASGSYGDSASIHYSVLVAFPTIFVRPSASTFPAAVF